MVKHKSELLKLNWFINFFFFTQNWLIELLRSPNLTDKYRNCKVGRQDSVLNRDLTIVYEFNFSGLPLHLKKKKIGSLN